MKLFKYLFFILVIGSFLSCKKSETEQIIGNWKLENYSLDTSFSSQMGLLGLASMNIAPQRIIITDCLIITEDNFNQFDTSSYIKKGDILEVKKNGDIDRMKFLMEKTKLTIKSKNGDFLFLKQ